VGVHFVSDVILSYEEIMSMSEVVAKKLVPFTPDDPLARREEVAAEAVLGVFESGERRPAMVKKILFRRAIDYLRRINHFEREIKGTRPKIQRDVHLLKHIASPLTDHLPADEAAQVIEAHLPTDMHVRVFRLLRSGESLREIGRSTNRTPGAVWTYIKKIREIGKNILGENSNE